MKRYYRVMLGRKSVHAEAARTGGYIGAGWFSGTDLRNASVESQRAFNSSMIPEYIKEHPHKSKIAAGLACGFLWTIIKGIQMGDIVLCPDGQGRYSVGEVTGGYEYHGGQDLPHRRPVRWYHETIARQDMSGALAHSAGSIGTVSDITQYAGEIEGLLSTKECIASTLLGADALDTGVFALEKHLEDFLVENWQSTELGKRYDIYQEEGEVVGQQYPSDTGPIDILAISKDKQELLIVELKRGRASDVVVGQIQRYMGYVKEELAEDHQKVSGVIIASEDDIRLHRALSVAQNIQFFTYKVQFSLEKKSKS